MALRDRLVSVTARSPNLSNMEQTAIRRVGTVNASDAPAKGSDYLWACCPESYQRGRPCFNAKLTAGYLNAVGKDGCWDVSGSGWEKKLQWRPNFKKRDRLSYSRQ